MWGGHIAYEMTASVQLCCVTHNEHRMENRLKNNIEHN